MRDILRSGKPFMSTVHFVNIAPLHKNIPQAMPIPAYVSIPIIKPKIKDD